MRNAMTYVRKRPVNLQDAAQHIMDAHPAIKPTLAALLGAGSSTVGLTADTSGWSETAAILADLGVFIGSVAALIGSLVAVYQMIRGRK